MEEQLECVWNMGDECEGDVTEQNMFQSEGSPDGQIKIPVCENHWTQHQELMFLHAKGQDVEEVLQLSREERRKLFQEVRARFPDEELPV